MALTHCADLSPADWITSATRPWEDLAGFGPDVFPAHARLRFVPDPGPDGEDPAQSHGEHEIDSVTDNESPTETDMLRKALDILATHTGTPDDCYFALWEGWGSALEGGEGVWLVDEESGAVTRGPLMAPAFPPSVMEGPKMQIPNRAYYLFRGKLSDFGDWGAAEMWPGQPRFGMPDPAFIWPADHAWCIANDVDPHWAGIGATTTAIEQLTASTALDAVVEDPYEDQPYYH